MKLIFVFLVLLNLGFAWKKKKSRNDTLIELNTQAWNDTF